jgi:hypothetical protein
MWMRENAAGGGRIGFDNGGDYYTNFAKDRLLSEFTGDYGNLLKGGEELLGDAEGILAPGVYPDKEELEKIVARGDVLMDKEDKLSEMYENVSEESLQGKDGPTESDKYYISKIKELEDREKDFEEREDKLTLEGLDVSGITRSPDFQAWYKLWEKGDPKADDHPNAEYFEELIFNVDRPTYMKVKYDFEMKSNGGRINKNTGGMMSVLPRGKEMDYRGGGVIPVGSRERADDVTASCRATCFTNRSRFRCSRFSFISRNWSWWTRS